MLFVGIRAIAITTPRRTKHLLLLANNTQYERNAWRDRSRSIYNDGDDARVELSMLAICGDHYMYVFVYVWDYKWKIAAQRNNNDTEKKQHHHHHNHHQQQHRCHSSSVAGSSVAPSMWHAPRHLHGAMRYDRLLVILFFVPIFTIYYEQISYIYIYSRILGL